MSSSSAQHPEHQSMRPLMLVGTASEVGKSWLATGILRWLRKKGFNPAPFKAQNMSLNSYATPEGGEIGRAQAVQAEAAQIPCHTDMNPILLKPQHHQTAQLILHGKLIGIQQAKQYFSTTPKTPLFQEACQAFQRLQAKYDPIVMEGAGSVSELNLKEQDIVNFRMAHAAEACVYLVADIDRGGVFASLYGTMQLLTQAEKQLVQGLIINKFRGEMSLFEPAKQQIEQLTQKPLIGVVPFAEHIHLPEEDSVSLHKKAFSPHSQKYNIAVVLFRHMANYTDFQALEQHPEAHLFYTDQAEDLLQADTILLPGSKQVMQEMLWMRKSGIATALQTAHKQGKTIIGLCGGYQLMGQHLHDPHGVESTIRHLPGLGLLPVSSTLSKQKQVGQAQFLFQEHPTPCTGYEIHMGHTHASSPRPLNHVLPDHRPEGYHHKNLLGTYLHGLFDNAVVVEQLLRLPKQTQPKTDPYDLLAEHLNKHLDLERIRKDLNKLK